MVLKASYAYAKAILIESKHGYGLLFLGLGAESMAATHNFPPTIEKIIREFAGPIAIALHRGVRNASSDTPLEKDSSSYDRGGLLAVWSGGGSGYCQRLRGHDHCD